MVNISEERPGQEPLEQFEQLNPPGQEVAEHRRPLE